MKITVLIPTHRRPALLRSALQSVQNQSRPDLVGEVIVSENSTDPASAEIAREFFTALPLRHVFQEPTVPPGEHFCRVLGRATNEWVALLGDDDMWGRYHLEEAVRCLEAHPEAVAFFAQDVFVRDESRVPFRVGTQSMLVSGFSPERRSRLTECWLLDHLDMAVSCVAATPLNMWGLVGRRDALTAAFEAFREPSSGYDSDRYMLWLLSKQGPVAVGREISLSYRRHDEAACGRLLREDYAFHQRMAAEYTRRMIADAMRNGIPLEESWSTAMRFLDARERNRFWHDAIPGAVTAIATAWPHRLKELGLERRKRRPRVKDVARAVCPPALWHWLASRRTSARKPERSMQDVAGSAKQL